MLNKEFRQLHQNRQQARIEVVQLAKKLKRIKTVFYDIEAKYKDKLLDYEKFDRRYAFELHRKTIKYKKRQKEKRQKEKRPYNAEKRLAEKAIKALESLPEELRAKIIANVQDGLF